MPNKADRRRFLTGVGAVATAAVAGCASDDEDPAADETDPDEDTDTGTDTDAGTDDDSDTTERSESVLRLTQIPQQTIDPIGIAGKASEGINRQTHEQLFTYENGTAPAVGELATNVEISDDFLTYTVELAEGVQFHNGDELTAQDVVYSLRRLAESENNRGHADRIIGSPMTVAHETEGEGDNETVVPGSLGVTAVGEYTVEITLESPFHGVLGVLTDPRFAVIPEGIVGDIEGYEGAVSYEEWSTERIDGTGPYQLETWNQGNEIVLTRYEDYHGSVANIPEIRWQIVTDPNARFTLAVNEQNVDIFDLPRSRFDPSLLEIEQDLGDGRRVGSYGPVNGETLNYGETTLLRTQYLIFHTLKVERPVREAIAYLIDQETVAETAVRGQGQAAYFLTPPAAFPDGASNYNDLAQSEYPYGYAESDIDAAARVMEQAGYGPDNRYSVSFQYPSDEQGSEWQEVASLLRDLAETAHIDIELDSAPSTTLTTRAIDGDIEIFGTFNELGWQEADATLRFAYPNPFTWTRWGQGDDGYSAPAQQAADAWSRYEDNQTPGAANQTARNEAYVELERANWADMTQLPLWHPIGERYWYDRVGNFEMHGPQYSQKYNNLSLE